MPVTSAASSQMLDVARRSTVPFPLRALHDGWTSPRSPRCISPVCAGRSHATLLDSFVPRKRHRAARVWMCTGIERGGGTMSA